MRSAGDDGLVPASPEPAAYEAPAVKVLGRVEDCTQVRLKHFGPTDGYEYQGNPIADASIIH